MPDQAFIKKLRFSGFRNWNTEACSHLNKVPTQVSIINARMYFPLNDKTVQEIDAPVLSRKEENYSNGHREAGNGKRR